LPEQADDDAISAHGQQPRAGSVALSLQRPLETFAECLGELS
jgi:hypothetical protein